MAVGAAFDVMRAKVLAPLSFVVRANTLVPEASPAAAFSFADCGPKLAGDSVR